jgi:hypothetical protein
MNRQERTPYIRRDVAVNGIDSDVLGNGLPDPVSVDSRTLFV